MLDLDTIRDDTKLYTPQEIADRFNLNQNTVFSWLRNGHIKGFKVGARWKVEEKEIFRFLQESTGRPIGQKSEIKVGELVVQWDQELIQVCDYWARQLKTTRSKFVGNIIVDRLARLSAETAVSGPKHLTLNEFAYGDDGELLDFKELYALRRYEYMREYQAALNKRDAQRDEQAKNL